MTDHDTLHDDEAPWWDLDPGVHEPDDCADDEPCCGNCNDGGCAWCDGSLVVPDSEPVTPETAMPFDNEPPF